MGCRGGPLPLPTLIPILTPHPRPHPSSPSPLFIPISILIWTPPPRRIGAVSGDVRRALEASRLAVQIAEREEADAVAAGGAPDPNSHVQVVHVSKAINRLNGSCAARALESAPVHQQMLLACLVLQQVATGRSEVAVDQLMIRHQALCRKLGKIKVS